MAQRPNRTVAQQDSQAFIARGTLSSLALWLFLLPAAQAHEIGTSNVRLAVQGDRWSAEITTAPTPLANKIGPQAGQPRGIALDADVVGTRLTAAAQIIAEYIEVRFDGAVSPVRVSVAQVEMPDDNALPAFVVLRAEGPVPAEAKTLTWRFGLIYSTYAVVFSDGSGNPITQWLDGDAESRTFPIGGNGPPRTRLEIVAQYLVLGFEHIVPKGLDHILFVLGLLLLANGLRPVLIQVTAFTVAHSVTLGLTLYGVIAVSPRLIEPLIALSIAYVAIENIVTPKLTPWRPVVVFGFGLVHGMGFAGALGELDLPHDQIIPALVSFNAGIELAQLTVIAAAYFAVAFWIGNKSWYRVRVVMPACMAIAAIGLFWTVQRVLDS